MLAAALGPTALTSASQSTTGKQNRHHDGLSVHRGIPGMVIRPVSQPRHQQDHHRITQDILHLMGLLLALTISGIHQALMTTGLRLALRSMGHLLATVTMGLRLTTTVLLRDTATTGLLQGMGPHHWTTGRHLGMVHQAMGHHHMAMGLRHTAMDHHHQVMDHHQHTVIRHQAIHLHTIHIQGSRTCLPCQRRQDSARRLQDMVHCHQWVTTRHRTWW
mmetsp:Transcript_7931/g.14453  ORF Transcript_7931/g.14453 Transcript_7931/m.14453 type:complete len:218 (+) Transcript_7931:366-1019(+)